MPILVHVPVYERTGGRGVAARYQQGSPTERRGDTDFLRSFARYGAGTDTGVAVRLLRHTLFVPRCTNNAQPADLFVA